MKRSNTHKSLERGLKILEIIAESSGSISLAEITKKGSLSKSTAYHLLVALAELGYVVKDVNSSKYSLSSRFMRLVRQKWSKEQIAEISKPYLSELSIRTGEGTSLAVLHNGVVLIVAKRDNDGPVRVVQEVGATRPIHCTAVGKALAAWLPEEELEEIIRNTNFQRMTQNTITSPDEFRKELNSIRQKGFALDDEEHIEGIRCVAVPVKDHFGDVCASLCVVGSKHRLKKKRIKDIVKHLFSVASNLSERLGFKNTNKGVREAE